MPVFACTTHSHSTAALHLKGLVRTQRALSAKSTIELAGDVMQSDHLYTPPSNGQAKNMFMDMFSPLSCQVRSLLQMQFRNWVVK
jgi:hypothetical protein